MARAARKAVKVLRAGAADAPPTAKATKAKTGGQDGGQDGGPRGDELVIVPAITAYVDVAEWDAKAESLGGNGYSMLAAISARLGERMAGATRTATSRC
jgi:hypothetical protein